MGIHYELYTRYIERLHKREEDTLRVTSKACNSLLPNAVQHAHMETSRINKSEEPSSEQRYGIGARRDLNYHSNNHSEENTAHISGTFSPELEQIENFYHSVDPEADLSELQYLRSQVAYQTVEKFRSVASSTT